MFDSVARPLLWSELQADAHVLDVSSHRPSLLELPVSVVV
jgi:hypothetical protein